MSVEHKLTESEKITYRQKVKTREELKEILGDCPREKKVIMCHGTFDLVHPGHVRHLIYAKSKADILVASLTTDAHIKKANYRPFVPQELRAFNLAALEMIDYVIIDENETPIEQILELRPDYFAKGYEYGKDGVHPKTQEEIDALESYGGEVIFTPGDIVYSSSFIIENNPPNLVYEKLESLMDAEGVSFNDLRNTVKDMEGVNIHVVGDTIIDTYTETTLIGGNTKTPTFSVKYQDHVDFIGGAGVVAQHMKKTGANVTLTTVLGDDSWKEFVLEGLKNSGVKCFHIVDHTRPTTNKNVYIAGGYRLLKVDTLDNRPISKTIRRTIEDQIKNEETDAVVFSDFRHGIFNTETIPSLIGSIPEGPLRVADSQVASRWGNILEFQNFDIITPNEKEARFSLGDQDSTIRPLALNLYNKSKSKLMILKLGDRGILTYRPSSHGIRAFFVVDSLVDRLVDAVGAGDALLAYSTLAMVKTKNPVIASILGSIGAALACEQEGNTPIEAEKVIDRINFIEKQINFKS